MVTGSRTASKKVQLSLVLRLKPEFRVLRCVLLPLGVSDALKRNVNGPKIKKRFPNDVQRLFFLTTSGKGTNVCVLGGHVEVWIPSQALWLRAEGKE